MGRDLPKGEGTMKKYGFEIRNDHGEWDKSDPGAQDPCNCFDTREEAELILPCLAEVLKCRASDIRIVEIEI
jgi:hypothetical protein